MEQPSSCLTELKPWQLSGAAKLRFLASSRFRGGILGDEHGLVKSLTTLTAMMAQFHDGLSGGKYDGFNLIITTKTCVPHWLDEIKQHFGVVR
jgi:SNF2 family DNA or RNA helicase